MKAGKADGLDATVQQAGLFIFLNYDIYFVFAGYLHSRRWSWLICDAIS